MAQRTQESNQHKDAAVEIPATRFRHLFAFAGALIALAGNPALAEETKSENPFDVKSAFRNICGFCHEDYGRKAGKGPQLMNSERTDQELFDRIKHGKPGRMAAFGAVFTDEQITQTVKFIRNLKPNEEPRNP
jgi:mono/diheme cytochrome c family protein